MKTVNIQTEDPAASRGRVRFDYKPDRHYVMVEAPSDKWDGDQLDKLLDVTDPKAGDFAYTIEAMGRTRDGRKITGHRNKVLLSCSKEFADRVAKENAEASHSLAREVKKADSVRNISFGGKNVQATETEQLDVQPAVAAERIIGS